MKHETNRIEYKHQLTEDLEKEAVAFLNYNEGGVMYIGIDDTGKAVGVRMIESLFAKRTRNSIGKIKSPNQNLIFEQLKNYYEGSKKNIKSTICSQP